MEAFVASFRDWANLDSLSIEVRTDIEASVRKRASAYRSGNVLVIPNPAILLSGVK